MKVLPLVCILVCFGFQTSSNIKASVCQKVNGDISKNEIKNCPVVLSDTVNYCIATFSIKWFNGMDTTEMPVHGQIPDFYHNLIDELEIGTTFIYNDIAIRHCNQEYVTIIPNLKFVIQE